MFLIRDYLMHESALGRKRMIKVLVKFCNKMIKFNNYPERWSKVVDVVTEKVKGPRKKKLRVLKLQKKTRILQ